jgi:daunorubicin resistance ABC transporter ATP-binding subunit
VVGNTVISVEKLVKVYPGGTRAVAEIDFSVRQGEFFGLLGPNGAGKSTTLKVLSTLLKKTSGRVVVAGYDVDRDPDAIRRSIGVAMQAVGLDDLATGKDFLELQGLLYGLSRSDARRRAMELLELVGLESVAQKKVGTYSGGMRRRLDLVAALAHQPSILFLDEPTTGLDPQSRLVLWDHLGRLNEEGTTIILTTQMMDEADRLCERLGIIDRGQIVAEGSPRALKAEIGGDVVTVTIGGLAEGDGRPQIERAAEAVSSRSYVSDVRGVDTGLAVTVQDGGTAAPDLLRLLHENGVSVTNLSVSSPTLDDVFLKHTGHTIRTEDVGGDEMNQAMRPWLGLNAK